MINVTDLRAGATFIEDGKPFIVLKYEHKKLGRGNAVIKTQVRNLRTGAVEERGFNSGNKVEDIVTTKQQLQFLYSDPSNASFMNMKTFETIEIPLPIVQDEVKYLKEGDQVYILFWDNDPLSIELPPSVVLTITATDPGVKGNSAANIYKSAKLENGMTVRVPLFIETGEKVRVDTRTGDYIERANK